jgi:hypothetical protein
MTSRRKRTPAKPRRPKKAPLPGPPPQWGEGEGDPEILALLDFAPVPRKPAKEPWTPDLQREFIARLAVHGAPDRACGELGKDRSGIKKLRHSPYGASFRAAWDKAIELAERRKADAAPAPEFVSPGESGPSVDNRRKHPRPGPPAPAGEGDGGDGGERGDEPTEDEKWAMLARIATKFMRKVAAEREARLAGKIVAADFHLRQITFLEVGFDLMSAEFGWDAQWALRELRRGRHHWREIVSSEFSDWLDEARRRWWDEEGEPERPPHPDIRFLERHAADDGDYATAAEMHACHGTRPPPGIGKAEWAALDKAQQQAAIDRVRARDAAEQRAWEEQARADHAARLDRGEAE